MLLSLVDVLRCPAGHVETSLVLSVEAWSGQRVSEGLLGCPECRVRYPIHRGAANFTGGTSLVRQAPGAPADAVRLAAQLSLTEPGGILLLTGRYAAIADRLAEVADVTCVLVDAPASAPMAAANFDVGDRLPFADRSLRAAAIDTLRGTETFMADVVRCVRPPGRIVAPLASIQPRGCRALARDAQEWVAEVEEFGTPLTLRRVRPTQAT